MPNQLDKAKNPEIGDYWHEMFCAVALVEHVYPNAVVAWVDAKPTPDDKGQQLTRLQAFTREEFITYLSYDSMPDKTWADCVRER